MQEDDEEDLILGIDLTFDICGKRFSQDTGQTTLTVKLESVERPGGFCLEMCGEVEKNIIFYMTAKSRKGLFMSNLY